MTIGRCPEVALVGTPLAGKSELTRAIASHCGGEVDFLDFTVPKDKRAPLWPALTIKLICTKTPRVLVISAHGGTPLNVVAGVIRRATAIVHCVDLTDCGGAPSLEYFDAYQPEILSKRRLVAITKSDLLSEAALDAGFLVNGVPVIRTSSETGEGIGDLVREIESLFK